MADTIIVHIDPELEDLIPGFLMNRRRDVESLRDLVTQSDWAAVRVIGHSMKGAGGGYGFDPITDLGGLIESAALAGDGSSVLEATRQLADYLSRVKPVFD